MLRSAVLLALFCTPAWAGPEEDQCAADVAAVRELAAALPVDDLSRRFAETDLNTALIEMSAGEVDECGELTERARHTVLTRPYQLRPGETLGRRPR